MALEELRKYTTENGPDGTPRLREGAVRSTCNRFVVYAVSDAEADKFGSLESFLNGLQGTQVE